MFSAKNALDKAVKLFKGRLRLRQAIKCKKGDIKDWYSGKMIPISYAKRIYEVCGGDVLLCEIRPDVWGIEVLKRIAEEQGYIISRVDNYE